MTKAVWMTLFSLPVIGIGLYLRRQWLQDAADMVNAKIKPPRRVFLDHDDRLRVQNQLRRDAADRLRRRANKVESGSVISDLRAVK